MKCLLRIMQGYWITHSDNYMPEVSPTQQNTNCFSSHRSYEIGLHFLLSFVETKRMIELTYNSLDTQILNSYLYLLAENIPQDISYHTQEISLDIMCRLYIYLKTCPLYCHCHCSSHTRYCTLAIISTQCHTHQYQFTLFVESSACLPGHCTPRHCDRSHQHNQRHAASYMQSECCQC